MNRPMSLEQFVRDRVEEEVLLARLSLSVRPPVDPGGAERRQRQRLVTDAVDRAEILALAERADHDSRHDLAARVRRRLALEYSSHSDFDPAWSAALDHEL